MRVIGSAPRRLGAKLAINLGSRQTYAKRLERWKQLGASAQQLARIHAPIGLKIGARTPEEIALAVAAQIVAARNNTLQSSP